MMEELRHAGVSSCVRKEFYFECCLEEDNAEKQMKILEEEKEQELDNDPKYQAWIEKQYKRSKKWLK
jgi:hypothetical protein